MRFQGKIVSGNGVALSTVGKVPALPGVSVLMQEFVVENAGGESA